MHQVESRRPISADWTLARSVRWHWPRQYACVFCGTNHCVVQNGIGPMCFFILVEHECSWIKRDTNTVFSGFGGWPLSTQYIRLAIASNFGQCESSTMVQDFFANAGIRCYICCKRVILLPSSACNVHCMVIILYKHHWSCYPETMRFWVHLIRWDKVFQNGFTFTVLFCIKSEWLRAVVLSIWFKLHEQTQCNYVALYDHVLESFNSPIVQIKE